MSEPDKRNREERALDDLKIYSVRGHSVVLDSDLAGVYGVETRAFNQAFRRNQERFPLGFRISTDKGGMGEFKITICDLKGRRKRAASEISSLGVHRARGADGRHDPLTLSKRWP